MPLSKLIHLGLIERRPGREYVDDVLESGVKESTEDVWDRT